MQQIALDIGIGANPTLTNYFAGPNGEALSHMQRLVQRPNTDSVPTYVWGAAGSGKTHLLRASAAAMQSQGASVGWLDASQAEVPEFDESWSLLVMDDVHIYDAQRQHSAFGWFVQAASLQRPVLCAGSSTPVDLLLREDLRTRLGWGHVFGLQPLTEAQTRAALRQAADARGLFLGDEVMDFTLRRFSRDLGTLFALLEELDRYALQTQRAISIPLLKSMLENT